MKTSRYLFTLILITLLATASIALGELTIEQATEAGKKSIQRLTDNSHHYRIEYDTIIALPVHSKHIMKNDFYLLYFLKDDYFQAEVEVDKVTGESTLLSVGKISQPYNDKPGKTFNHKYFNNDSILEYGFKRFRLEQDSARPVYFGVIPRLGKRGAVWELFYSQGTKYVNFAGRTLSNNQLVREMNASQRRQGNFAADSIRLVDIIEDIVRLKALTAEERRQLDLKPEKIDSLVGSYMGDVEVTYMKYPDLRRRVKLPVEEPDSLKN